MTTLVFFDQYHEDGTFDLDPQYSPLHRYVEDVPAVGDLVALPDVPYPVQFKVTGRRWVYKDREDGTLGKTAFLRVVRVDASAGIPSAEQRADG